MPRITRPVFMEREGFARLRKIAVARIAICVFELNKAKSGTAASCSNRDDKHSPAGKDDPPRPSALSI